MRSELLGKWYVYRYNLGTPVLKAPETSLEIKEKNGSCLARFELSEFSGGARPVEVAMTAEASDWYGTSDWTDEFGKRRFGVRWSESQPGVLTGQVYNRDAPGELRDFFVAVRSRRTDRLPAKSNYSFQGARWTPFKKNEPSTPEEGLSIDLDKKEILFKETIYKIGAQPKTYGRGLKLGGRYRDNNDPYPHVLRLWILPVDATGRLLATGYHEHHAGEANTGSSRPECQLGFQLC